MAIDSYYNITDYFQEDIHKQLLALVGNLCINKHPDGQPSSTWRYIQVLPRL